MSGKLVKKQKKGKLLETMAEIYINDISAINLYDYILKINNKSEPVTYRDDMVRIICVWCERGDLNSHVS